MDLINNVHGGKKSKLFTPQRLKMMSITPEQFAGMKNLVKKHLKKGPEGTYEIVNKADFQSDPRAMDLWRMGDKIADETILRPHKLSSQDTKAYGAGIKLAMQFKNFTLRSMNARLVRGIYDSTKNGQAIDQVLQQSIAVGLATAMYAAMKYGQAASMDKEKRGDFLKQSLNPNMLAYAAISRSSHAGAPMGIANQIGRASCRERV